MYIKKRETETERKNSLTSSIEKIKKVKDLNDEEERMKEKMKHKQNQANPNSKTVGWLQIAHLPEHFHQDAHTGGSEGQACPE